MRTYSEFQPTGFDPRGLGLEDQQDWLVLPCGRNRDSGPLDESNFHSALKSLGGESETVEVHRFGHWACGWFEIIVVHPDRASEAEKIEGALADYPVLDDSDYSEREWDVITESWGNFDFEDCKRYLASEYELQDSTVDRIPSGALFELVTRNETPAVESDGTYYDFKRLFRRFSRDDLARWLLANRAPRS